MNHFEYRARFQDNRTIFNTPNPRLMNVSLLKGKSLLRSGGNTTGGQRSRRGSQTSINSGGLQEKEGGGGGQGQASSSSKVPRTKMPRQQSQSQDVESGGGSSSTRPISNKGKKLRTQDSVTSNSNV